MTEEELDRLSSLARAGDKAAVARVVVHLHPELARISRREAKGYVDPEDLQSHAIESLLRAWSQQSGPSSNVLGYLVQTMRYRVIDEMRSPRSRTRNLYDTEDFVSDADPSAAVELDTEARLVRRALRQLKPEQQRLLMRLYYDGVKPAQLATELEKSPNAIYSLTRRSKQALRQALLREAIVERGGRSCRKAAADLPESIADSFEATPASTPGMRHVGGCEHCKSAWQRFGGVASALGLASLVVIAGDGVSSTAAAAIGAVPEQIAEHEAEAAPRETTADARAHMTADGGRLAQGSAADAAQPFRAERWKHALLGSAVGTVVGALAASAAYATVTAGADVSAPAGELTMSVAHQDQTDVDVAFETDDESGISGRVTLHYPSSLTVQGVPEGADCAASATLITCTASNSTSLRYTFSFEGATSLGEDLELTLDAAAGDYVFTGSMRSAVPEAGSSATTTAEVLAGS